MKISVFGLGYVGAVTSACFAQRGHEVIGIDVNQQKVDIINNGRSPVIEKDINGIIAQVVSSGALRAATDAEDGILNSDVSLICVGTPSNNNGSLDLTYAKRVCEDIGNALQKKVGFHTIVLRSTVLPGTTKNVIIPALEKASGLVAGKDFNVSHNPEFLREGTSVYDFNHPPFTVIGHPDSNPKDLFEELYKGIDAPMVFVSLEAAEMVKYSCNAFHALKVTFANEIGNICKKMGVDSHDVMDIFCMDDKLNLSPYYLKPGFAFGGSCLPKDLRALLYHGHRQDLSLPVLEAILPSNEMQIKHGLDLIKQTGSKKVGILGFSFKAGTDDLRESPLVEMIENLIGKGYQIKVYDKHVSIAKLHGANREYIEREIPHISTLMCENIEDVLDTSEVIVIGNNSPEFNQVLEKLSPEQIIIDLVRITKETTQLNSQYQGICW